MFIHASDPERIQKELQQLSYQLADLVKQVDYLTRNIVTTSPRAKQTLPAMFVQEVHRQMSLGIPEDIAVDDARDALDMTKKALFSIGRVQNRTKKIWNDTPKFTVARFCTSASFLFQKSQKP